MLWSLAEQSVGAKGLNEGCMAAILWDSHLSAYGVFNYQSRRRFLIGLYPIGAAQRADTVRAGKNFRSAHGDLRLPDPNPLMKTSPYRSRFTTTFALVALAAVGCSRQDPATSSATHAVAQSAPAGMVNVETVMTVPPVAIVAPNVTSAQWTDFKDISYEMRESLFAGLDRLQARVDGQIIELTAKRAAMDQNNTSTQQWDFAMKEMADSRAYLQAMSDALTKTNREIWQQQKDRVGQAWVRTQEAYAKVKASTTN